MGLSTTHLIIFLIIIVVIFGTKKLHPASSCGALPSLPALGPQLRVQALPR